MFFFVPRPILFFFFNEKESIAEMFLKNFYLTLCDGYLKRLVSLIDFSAEIDI